MLDTALAVVGILISIVFFIVGYRQTVGAKKERIAACNAEVERILLRRIVLESYSPTRLDLDRLLDGKGRDFRVRSDDLRSAAQVMNTLYTRIVESDVIPAQERRSILERIAATLADSENRSAAEVEDEVSASQRLSRTMPVVVGMAAMASAVGSLTTLVPDVFGRSPITLELLKTPAIVAAISLAFISLLLIAFRLRASQEENPTKGEEVQRYVRLETDVASILNKGGFSVVAAPSGRAGDFVAQRDGRKYVIEVKSWPRRVPAQVLATLGERLRRTAAEVGADEVILVTQVPLLEAAENIQIPGVTFVTAKDLAAYLRKRSNSAA